MMRSGKQLQVTKLNNFLEEIISSYVLPLLFVSLDHSLAYYVENISLLQ